MSALAAIPAVGDAAAAAKMAKKAATVGDVVRAVDKVDDVAGGVKTALKAADAASDAKAASAPIAKAIDAANQARTNVDKVIPRRVQNVLAKRQDEIQAGAEFTSNTVSDVQQALEENGGELKPGQLGEILSGNVKSAAVGYAADKVIGNAVENVAGGVVDRVKRRRGGGVDAPDVPRSAAPARTQVEADSTPATRQPQSTATPNSTFTNSARLANRNQLETSAPSSHVDNNQSVPESATPTRRSETESEVITPTKQPELEEGLAHDPKARNIVEKDPELADTLVETAPKNLNQLSDQQIEAELKLADQLPSKTIRDGDYVEQTVLPNDHEWNIREDRIPCRHSDEGFCLLPNGDKTPEETLMDAVHQDSQDMVDGNSAGILKDRAATARASSPDLGPGTEISGDYQNIFNPKKKGGNRRAKYYEFDGVSDKPINVGGEDFLAITDKDKFITNIKDRYRDDLDERLHPITEQRIKELISQDNYIFNMSHGIPGLHAEVQATNKILNRLEEEGIEITQDVLDRIQVATYRLAPKGKRHEQFGACPNCQDILLDFLKKENILTGLAER